MNAKEKPPKKTRKRKYRWAEWFKLESFTLIHGRDYTGQTHGMANMVRNRASADGVKVSIKVTNERRIVVTVLSNVGGA